MKLQIVGCSHHTASVHVRERLAFNATQAREALALFRSRFPDTEAVLLSTCNRVELYTASLNAHTCPNHEQLVHFLADFHGLAPTEVFDELFERTGEDAIRHLFMVAGSLDSMVVGEAQILSQVKQAYDLAVADNSAGPLTHGAFQAALRVAKRIATETAINQKRVSIPSVAVGDFAKQVFETFTDKHVLVIGAGEMAEETLAYLASEGARQITVVNRNTERAAALAVRHQGTVGRWEDLPQLLVEADVVVSATAAKDPIVTREQFRQIEHQRAQRTLFILDLAVPRDFDPKIHNGLNVYLYSVDDLRQACDRNRAAREKEWPKAVRIVEEETAQFMADLHHRATAPTIQRLRERGDEIKEDELERLFKRLEGLDDRTRREITQAFDRLVNKLLHPPLKSLREEAQLGAPHGLLEAMRRLFQLKD